MASLQTLRDKGGVIVSIAIGLALAAFVLGDLLNSNSTLLGSSDSNVGEIAGEKITQAEFQHKIKTLTEVAKVRSGGQSSNSDQEIDYLQNQTWDRLYRQHSLMPALHAAGFMVSNAELLTLLSGDTKSELIIQQFSDRETGLFSDEYYTNFIENKDQDPTGGAKLFWEDLQEEVAFQALVMKYKALVDQGSYVTAFEVKQMAALESNGFAVRFVASPYTSVSDSEVVISEADAKAFYTSHPKMFFVDASRSIDYVAFMTTPSPEDYAAAEIEIQKVKSDFKIAENPSQFARRIPRNDGSSDLRYYKESELAGALGEFAFSAKKDSVYGPELVADQYTLARIADSREMPDSVGFSHILMTPDLKATADSLLIELRKGGDFAAAAAKFSLDKSTNNNGGVVATLDPQTLPAQFLDPIVKATKDQIIMVESEQSINIIKITKLVGVGRKVQLAFIKKAIEPSEHTRNVSYEKASAFVTSAKNGFETAFLANTPAKRSATVKPSDKNVQGLVRSHDLAVWANKAKKNDVSAVFSFEGMYVVATLKTITETGTAPFADVNKSIVDRLAQVKKGEILAAKMKGATSVDELATKLSLTVTDGEDINWNTFVVPGIGLDPAFAGAVCTMDASKISKPITGSAAVYAVQIVSKEPKDTDLAMLKERLSAEARQRAFSDTYKTLMKMSNIKDMRYRLY